MKTLTQEEKQKRQDSMLKGMQKTYEENCRKIVIWRRANGCTDHGKWGK